MKVYALFDNREVEKISLEFLQPSSKGDRIDICFLNSVPDNIRNSVDVGIKETFILLHNKFKKAPDKISIWFRGFSKSVQGNSFDLAFAISLISSFIELGHIKANVIPDVISATGIISSEYQIQEVIGIKEKVWAALKLCGPDIKHFLFLPESNFIELSEIRKNDEAFDLEIRNSNIELVPVKTLFDVLNSFKIPSSKAKINIAAIAGIALCFVIVLISLFKFINSHSSVPTASHSSVPTASLPSASITNINPIQSTETTLQVKEIPKKPAIDNNNAHKSSNSEVSTTLPETNTPNVSTQAIESSVTETLNDNKQFISVISTDPKNLEQNVKAKEKSIKVTFDSKNILEGANFNNIKIIDENNKDGPFALDLKNGTITLQYEFEYNKKYTVIIPKGTVENENALINKEYSFSFTTEQRPDVFMDTLYTIPSNGDTNVDINTNKILLRFDTNEKVVTGYKGIAISGIHPDGICFNKNTPTIEFSGLKNNTKYLVTIPEGAFVDAKGIYNKAFEFSFTTAP